MFTTNLFSAGRGFTNINNAYSYLRGCNYHPDLRAAHTVERDTVSCRWVIVYHPERFLKTGGKL